MDLVQKIRIQNFKSIVDTEFELGRVNVFIGPNGGGKSNVFEAVAFASAASRMMLSNDYLASRGVRTGKLTDILSSLTHSKKQIFELSISTNEDNERFRITADKSPYPAWRETNQEKALEMLDNYFSGRFDISAKNSFLSEMPNDVRVFMETLNNVAVEEKSNPLRNMFKQNVFPKLMNQLNVFDNSTYSKFIIYNPNIQVLRNGNSDVDVSPVDYNGNGLLKLVSTIKGDDLELLNNALSVIDWFASFKTVEKNPMDFELAIRDRFSAKKAFNLNQWSANEGFLYILFYHTVILSQYTPSFFAIENIETALNPRLATETMRQVVQLAKEKDKQLLVSTHSPDVLDGLDLTDPEQRLFVVNRNIDGHTFVEPIVLEPAILEKHSLSHLFRIGAIGGLQDTF